MRIRFFFLFSLQGAWDVTLPHWLAHYHDVWPATSLRSPCACLTPFQRQWKEAGFEKWFSATYPADEHMPACTVTLPLLREWDEKLKASHGKNSWPELRSCQAPGTLAGLFQDLTSCLGRINEVLHFDHQDDEPFLWPELFLFRGGRGGSNKRQAGSSLVISWEAGTPLLPNWHCRATNKGFLPGRGNRLLAPCAAATAGSLPWFPKRKLAGVAQGNTWPVHCTNEDGEDPSF